MRISAKKIFFQFWWPIFAVLKHVSKTLYLWCLRYEFYKDWGSFPNPEWFNHEFDLVFFPHWRKPHFFERGIYIQEMLDGKQRVLDLCSGDGSVAALFIAPKASNVEAVDFDPSAVRSAKQKYAHIKNINFQTMDIRRLNFSEQYFDAVTWDAAIEHFTKEEMDLIFQSIHRVLLPNGLLLGSTVAKLENTQHHDHEYEFATLSELEQFLKQYFAYVYVWERKHQDRINFYFRCSNNSFKKNLWSSREMVANKPS